MITTNDPALYRNLLQLRTHGILKDENHYLNTIEFAGGKEMYPTWYMEMQQLGYNYRIDEVRAALGIGGASLY